MHQVEKVEGRGAAGRLDVAPGSSRKVKNVEILVRDHVSRSVALHDALGAASKAAIGSGRYRLDRTGIRDAPAAGCDREIGQVPRAAVQPPEDAGAAVDGGEKLGMTCHVLGIAEKEEPVRQQREMEQRDDAALQLRVQIDQAVAAGEDWKCTRLNSRHA